MLSVCDSQIYIAFLFFWKKKFDFCLPGMLLSGLCTLLSAQLWIKLYQFFCKNCPFVIYTDVVKNGQVGWAEIKLIFFKKKDFCWQKVNKNFARYSTFNILPRQLFLWTKIWLCDISRNTSETLYVYVLLCSLYFYVLFCSWCHVIHTVDLTAVFCRTNYYGPWFFRWWAVHKVCHTKIWPFWPPSQTLVTQSCNTLMFSWPLLLWSPPRPIPPDLSLPRHANKERVFSVLFLCTR